MHVIKIYRKRHNLNRVAFAALVRVHYETVRMWEKRKTKPSATMTLRIEKATEGEVKRHELRPDFWPPEDSKAA